MNRKRFYASVRTSLFGGALNTKQVDGMERILDYRAQIWPGVSDDELAYILATTKWETGHTMQPVREGGSEAYLRSKKYYPWVGEGLVQITWESNHKKFGATRPGQMMTWPKALDALFRGMILGMYGKKGEKLSDFIGNGKLDYLNARRIVNLMDKASTIEGYAYKFRQALIDARETSEKPATDTTHEKPADTVDVSREEPAIEAPAEIPVSVMLAHILRTVTETQRTMTQELTLMAKTLQEVVDEVAAQTTAVNGLEKFVNGLKDRVKEIPDLTPEMQAQIDMIFEHVNMNTAKITEAMAEYEVSPPPVVEERK